MPSLMAARWVGQNSGPIFLRLYTKVHWIKFACAGVSVVCNIVFQLTMSCCIRETLAKLSKIAPTLCFWDTKFRGKGPPKFLTEFYKSWSPTLTMFDRATLEIRRQKKKEKDLNNSSKTEWPTAATIMLPDTMLADVIVKLWLRT